LFAVEARQWRTYPDTTSAALRRCDLRSAAGAEPADSVAQILWLVRLAKPDMRADEPELKTVDG